LGCFSSTAVGRTGKDEDIASETLKLLSWLTTKHWWTKEVNETSASNTNTSYKFKRFPLWKQ
jgi:hypothetical protein